MSSNPLRVLNSLGQSVWFDYIRRDGVDFRTSEDS